MMNTSAVSKDSNGAKMVLFYQGASAFSNDLRDPPVRKKPELLLRKIQVVKRQGKKYCREQQTKSLI